MLIAFWWVATALSSFGGREKKTQDVSTGLKNKGNAEKCPKSCSSSNGRLKLDPKVSPIDLCVKMLNFNAETNMFSAWLK